MSTTFRKKDERDSDFEPDNPGDSSPDSESTDDDEVDYSQPCQVGQARRGPATPGPATSGPATPGPSTSGAGTNEEQPTKKRGRKKTPEPDTWAKNVAKKRRNLGLAYTAYTSKKDVAARKMGPACSDGCFDKIGADNAEKIFKEFWAIGNYNQQNQHLQGLIKEVPIKRRRTKEEDKQRHRQCNYFVKKNYIDIKICRQAFMSVHGITKKKLEILMKKRELSPTGTPTSDKRGKHPPSRKIQGPPYDCVVEHIKSLPTTASHYTRAHSPERRYMDSAMTQEDLFTQYVFWMQDQNPDVPIVSPRFYKEVFRRDFNILFRPPQTDLCNKCELLEARIKARRAKGKGTQDLEDELESHKLAAKVPQDLLSEAEVDSKKAGPDSDLRTIAIDLQQTLPCPSIRTGHAYYKRKLWLYNFCIYDLNMDKANMYIWTEDTAHRGSDEIGSCIKKWLEGVLQDGGTFRRLRIYADNCAGQNKNINIVLLALRMIHTRALDRIEIVFMVPGHSYLPCDRAFGHIEKKIRRQQNIYSPEKYVNIIENAVGKKNNVVVMKTEDFFNIRCLKDAVSIRPSTGFSKARQLVVDATYPEGYTIKNTYIFDTEFAHTDKKVRLMPGRARYSHSVFNLADADLPPKYSGFIRVNPEKLKDLRGLWPFLDLKGRHWLSKLFEDQGQAPQDDDTESDEEPDDLDPENNTMDYLPPVLITPPPAPAALGDVDSD